MAKRRQLAVEKVLIAQQAGLMRMQLYFTGATHQLLRGFLDKVQAAMVEATAQDGTLDGLGLYRVNRMIEREWSQTFAAWKKLFELMRREAAALPVGALAAMHQHYFGFGGKEERMVEEARKIIRDGVFEPQLQAVLDAAEARVYGDGLNLSGRIWKLDRESREHIQRTLSQGVADKRSAYDIAKDLERALGAGKECPRWTKARLNGLTKADIASGDRTGLLSGDACDESGVAYNALRLARNELQIAHHMASDALMARQPWVESEQINLSPDHAKDDECDDVANGGEKGDGVYPKGEISLPLHVQCLCYKTAVLMDEQDFMNDLRGWTRRESEWPEMDQYAEMIGWGGEALPGPITGVLVGALVAWVWDEMDDLIDRLDDL